MEFSEVVRRRRMVRSYTDEPVDRAAIERMLHNATRAPSAGFSQGWAFLALTTPDEVAAFWTATSPGGDSSWLRGMRTAPAIVVPLSNKQAYLDRYAEPDKAGTTRWPVPYWHIDTGMAALLILQTAVDEGLGACFFGIPGERIDSFRDAFAVPESFKPIGAITVGHPAPGGAQGSPARRERRDDTAHWGRWQD